ncbi:MAG TPA: NAD(P)-dependent oxidoreductase [Candidatus Acidoferrales bacterium]|nr:NAD(P)-dependent oxidoreductase [Candidatus Acidoferrales bacterium]
MTTRVAFIGLGLMGRPMSLNLLKAGFPVTVWNRTRARTEPLAAAGASVAPSPREAAQHSDVAITIVSDPPALEAVLGGPDGVLAGLKRGSLLIDSSTVSPALARRVALDCAQRAIEFLDAPVTGGTWGAEKGELVFMIGGKAATLERARPVFEAMGKRYFHLGENGAGQTVKLAMNLILALEVQALCEALALVTGSGISGQKLVEVMQASMARAPVLDVKAPLVLEHKFAPSFPLRLMHKDMGLALELGNQTGVSLPAAAAAREVYNFVLGSAKEDLDFAAIAKFWQPR